MIGKDFLETGHWPTLLAALLYLAMSFMVWILVGPLGVQIANELHLDAAKVGFWLHGIHSYAEVLALGLVLGVAGASFAVALPLAFRWHSAKYQGVALGIAGAANSGTFLAALFAPTLAIAVGWRNVIGLATTPLALAFIVYLACAKDRPDRAGQMTGGYQAGFLVFATLAALALATLIRVKRRWRAIWTAQAAAAARI